MGGSIGIYDNYYANPATGLTRGCYPPKLLAMKPRPIHVVLWLPGDFYSAVAATIVEIFQLVNVGRSYSA